MSDQDDLETKIEQKYQEIQDANYYEILGVQPSAGETTIRKAFRKLAKKWHADRYDTDQMSEETREKLQTIFAEINNAQRTLSNPEDRDEYDAALNTGDTDLESVIDAEDAFRRGRNMLDAGRYEGAHEKFREACQRSPDDEPDYRAHRLYTEYVLIPKNEQGKPKKQERAREIFRELDTIADESPKDKDWLFAFMGAVAMGFGRRQEAKDLFNEALELNSDNTLAKRQLRLIRMRENKQKESQGFFAKLFSKFTS